MSSVIKRINEYNKALPEDLKNLKFKAMSESPFRFYRGTCHLFAEDFKELYGFDSKLKTWICGDLHFENFGSYKGANRLVYFDLNDFDESVLAPPQPEITRFLTSIIIAGEQMKVNAASIHKTLEEVTDLYTATLSAGKALMVESELAKGILKKYFHRLQSRNRETFIAKHTSHVKGKITLKPDGVHLLPIAKKKRQEIFDGLMPLLKRNKHFADLNFLDAAFRIAGTGSLGLERYVVLCYDKNKKKHYLIDIKQARRSCFKDLVKIKQPAFGNEAERIIYSEYTMQFYATAFLSATKISNKWFIVKEMQPLVDKLSLKNFGNDFAALKESAFDMAPLIAYDQLRSSGHKGASTADELMRFADKGKWKKEVIDLSAKLADNNSRYFKAFYESAD